MYHNCERHVAYIFAYVEGPQHPELIAQPDTLKATTLPEVPQSVGRPSPTWLRTWVLWLRAWVFWEGLFRSVAGGQPL